MYLCVRGRDLSCHFYGKNLVSKKLIFLPHNEDTRATFDKIRFEKKSDPKERKKERICF